MRPDGQVDIDNFRKTNPENRPILPKQAFTGFGSRFREPQIEEGFEEIIETDFQVRTHASGLQ
jgi:hypothetical protein